MCISYLLGVSLLLLSLVGLLISQDSANAQPNSRFPTFSECLDNGHSAGTNLNGSDSKCITCDAVVEVDVTSGFSCPPQGKNLSGLVCDDLDQVLESIMLGYTTASSCIEVLIYPKYAGESYVVWANKSRGITQNVVLRGMTQVK